MTYSESFKDLINFSEKVSWRNFHNSIKLHKNIIIDRTNLTPSSRKKYLNIIKNTSIPYKKVCLVLARPSEKELKRRIEYRNDDLLCNKFIPEEVMNDMFNRFIYPTKEEGFDQIIHVDDNLQFIPKVMYES
jgi:tRNA uridine 5-carbamoylmethylation protein Kti12